MEKAERINQLLERRLQGELTNSEEEELAQLGERIAELLAKRMYHRLTIDEERELTAYLNAYPENQRLWEALGNDPFRHAYEVLERFDLEGNWNKLSRRVYEAAFPARPLWKDMLRKAAVAAGILLILGALIYLMVVNNDEKPPTDSVAIKDIVPNDTAILYLSDGSRVYWDSLSNGKVPVQGNAVLEKTNDHALTYRRAVGHGLTTTSDAVYNVVSVPKGRRLLLTLPDDTQIWVNAGSVLRYKVNTDTSSRNVELRGEAFFDVAKIQAGQHKVPFQVHVQGLNIQVTGTRFNVEGYDEEPRVKTTLVEGSVIVKNGLHQQKLTPGHAAFLDKKDGRLTTEEADTVNISSWRNGMMTIYRDRLPDIMRKISRAYNTKIVYQGPVTQFKETVSGTFPVDSVLLPHFLYAIEGVFANKIKLTIKSDTVYVAPITK